MLVQFQVMGETEKNYKRLLETASDSGTLLRRALAVFDMIQGLQKADGQIILVTQEGRRRVLRDVWD